MMKKNNIVVEQEKLPIAVSEMVSDNKFILKYRSGKMSKKEFNTFGIRFAKPL